MLKRILKLAEIIYAEDEREYYRSLPIWNSYIQKNAHYASMSGPGDYDFSKETGNLPWSGNMSEFLKKFPGGLPQWNRMREDLKRDAFNIDQDIMVTKQDLIPMKVPKLQRPPQKSYMAKEAKYVPDTDGNTPSMWRKNMDYAGWENSPYFGSMSEFLKKFPGGIEEWRKWREKNKKERYKMWDIKKRKAHILHLMEKKGELDYDDLSGDYEPTKEEREYAEEPATKEEREKAFELLLKNIEMIKEMADLSDEEVKAWLEKYYGQTGMAAEDWDPNEDPEGDLEDYYKDQETFTYEGEKAPKPDLNRWKSEWRAERYAKNIKPFIIKDWRVVKDDDGTYYLLQALHVDPVSVHGWQPKGTKGDYNWYVVDKKPTKYSVPNMEDTELEDIQFAEDKTNAFTGYIGPIEKQTKDNTDYRQALFTGKHAQLVLMNIKAGKEIGEEIHNDTDQFFRIESGEGKFILNGEENEVKDGDAVFVPAGTKHNIINISHYNPLKLYTIYSPPNHPEGTLEETKCEEEHNANDVRKTSHYVPEGGDDVDKFKKEPHLYSGEMDKFQSISEYLNKYHQGQDAKDAAFDAAKDFVRYWRQILKKKEAVKEGRKRIAGRLAVIESDLCI